MDPFVHCVLTLRPTVHRAPFVEPPCHTPLAKKLRKVGVSEVRSTRFCLIKKSGLLTPGQSRSRVLGQFAHAGFIFDVHFPQFGGISGAERAQRRARARNRAKRVRGGMGVNSPSMKTHRATQGLGWCIETRVWIPAFVLWRRR